MTLPVTMDEASLVSVADLDDGISLTLRLTEKLSYFQGHFPGQPILPGVVQSGWAVLYGHRYLGLPEHIQALEVLKYRKVIQPGDEITLNLQKKPSGKLVFQYTKGDDVLSSGRLVYLTVEEAE